MKNASPFWKTIAVLFLVLNAAGWWYASSRASSRTSRPDSPVNDSASEAAVAAKAAAEEATAAAAAAKAAAAAFPTVVPVPNAGASNNAAPTVPTPVVVRPAAPQIQPIGLDWATVSTGSFDDPSIWLDFSSDMDLETLSRKITVRPACEFHVSKRYAYWNDEFSVSGKFVPGTEYTVTIPAGTPGKSGNRAVLSDIVKKFTIPNRPPAVAFADSGRAVSFALRQAFEH